MDPERKTYRLLFAEVAALLVLGGTWALWPASDVPEVGWRGGTAGSAVSSHGIVGMAGGCRTGMEREGPRDLWPAKRKSAKPATAAAMERRRMAIG